MKKIVHVAVGVILKAQQVYIAKRLSNQHQGGKWEFPGGKVESGETVTQALARELAEEVGITVNQSVELMQIKHDYDDKSVLLDVHLVRDFSGEPSHQEGQQSGWFAISQLNAMEFPAANKVIIDKLIADL